MDGLRAVRVFIVNATPGRRQRLGSDGFDDKLAGTYPSTTSETSSDNLEAGFVKIGQLQKPSLDRRLMEYAHRRTTNIVDWSCSQSRSFWACTISGGLAIVVILYAHPFVLLWLVIVHKSGSLMPHSVLVALVVYFNIHLRSLIPRNDIERIVASWGAPGSPTHEDAHYPTDFSRDITPIPCHSHNDYWRISHA